MGSTLLPAQRTEIVRLIGRVWTAGFEPVVHALADETAAA